MNRITPIVVLGLSSLATAQSPFLDPFELTFTPDSPVAYAVADFTGNGINDIVTGSDRLALARAMGGHQFLPQIGITNDHVDVQAMAAGDIDGDGDPDLVIVDAASGVSDLVWYESIAPGNARRRALVTNVPDVSEVQLADMDADGDLDFVAYLPGTDSIVYYTNDQGSAGPVALPVGPYVNARWRVADVNQDGLVDLVFEQIEQLGPPDVVVSLGTTPGRFAAPRSLFGTISGLRGARLADTDGDGDLDGVLTTSNSILIAEASGPLAFLPPAEVLALGSSSFPVVEAAEDLNGDGLTDIAYQELGPTPFEFNAFWIAGLPNGGFALPDESRRPFDFDRVFDYADVNGDGLVDGIKLSSNGVRIRINQGASTPALFESPLGISTTTHPFADAAALDLEGDGDLDVLALQEATRTISVYLNGGDGSFAQDDSLSYSGLQARSIWARDFDRDGDDDLLLLTGTAQEDALVILRNDGGHVFQEQAVFSPAMARINDPQIEDLDGDGDLDIVVSSGGGTSPLKWLRNENSGASFTEILVGMPAGTTVGDVDDDGRLDFVCVRPGTQTLPESVTWRRNLGNGNFAVEAALLTAFGPSTVTLADLGGDGATDILLNQGNPIFVANAIAAGSSYGFLTNTGAFFVDVGRRLETLDLNGDGLVDLVGYQDFSFARLWVNTGTGPMAPPVPIFPMTGSTVPPKFHDLDGDGDLDALGVSGSEIWVAPNSTSRRIGTSVCGPAVPNSSGNSAKIQAFGSTDLAAMDLSLFAEQMPVFTTGIFLASRNIGSPVPIANSRGNLCLTGAVGRFSRPSEIFQTVFGVAQLPIDVTAIPQANGRVPIQPGETWYFQAWFRDTIFPNGATSNLTDAVSITF